MRRHASELLLTRAITGELGPWARFRLRRHLARCQQCQEAHAGLLHERALFDAAPERRRETQRLVARHAAPTPRHFGAPRPPIRLAVAGAACAVAVLSVMVLRSWGGDDSDLAAKGGPAAQAVDRFTLFVKRGEADAVALAGVCRPGDLLRGRYETKKSYLLVLGADVRGEAVVLFPYGRTESAAVSESPGLTPGSWMVDATPGRERIVALFSNRQLALAEAQEALKPAPARSASLVDVTIVEVQCDKELP